MTFAHYEFKKDTWIHEHHHPQEAVWQVIEGKLDITIDGKVIVVDYPLRG
jgi:quercetin dioxygenase-like cupin family protein